jgi:hypothetical protein
MSSYLGDLATGIWDDLGQPSTVSVENVSGWLYTNIGKLNAYIDTCFSGVEGTGFNAELNNREGAIYAQIYKLKFYEGQITSNLGAASYSVVELREGDHVLRLASKTELAKTYKELKSQEQNVLKGLIGDYKLDRAQPRAIFFD